MQEQMVKELNEKFFKDEPVKLTDDQFNYFDCYNDKYVIELKNRRPPYGPSSFNGSTMIEKIKYDALVNEAKKSNRKALYIVRFDTTKEFYLWNLDKHQDLFWSEDSKPATTDFENNNMINKVSADLFIKDAVKII
jgi:hypothetical protein